MMDPMTGANRGYAFVTFTSRDATQRAVQEVGGHTCRRHVSWVGGEWWTDLSLVGIGWEYNVLYKVIKMCDGIWKSADKN